MLELLNFPLGIKIKVESEVNQKLVETILLNAHKSVGPHKIALRFFSNILIYLTTQNSSKTIFFTSF